MRAKWLLGTLVGALVLRSSGYPIFAWSYAAMPVTSEVTGNVRAAIVAAGVHDPGEDWAQSFVSGIRRRMRQAAERTGDATLNEELAAAERVPIVQHIVSILRHGAALTAAGEAHAVYTILHWATRRTPL